LSCFRGCCQSAVAFAAGAALWCVRVAGDRELVGCSVVRTAGDASSGVAAGFASGLAPCGLLAGWLGFGFGWPCFWGHPQRCGRRCWHPQRCVRGSRRGSGRRRSWWGWGWRRRSWWGWGWRSRDWGTWLGSRSGCWWRWGWLRWDRRKRLDLAIQQDLLEGS
jgi:hypothetical protein